MVAAPQMVSCRHWNAFVTTHRGKIYLRKLCITFNVFLFAKLAPAICSLWSCRASPGFVQMT